MVDSASRSATTRCACESASPISRRAHRASLPTEPRVRLDRGAHLLDGEVAVARVVKHGEHEGTGVRVEPGRDLTVEVAGDRVTDIGLDQAFQPVRRSGLAVEVVERLRERLHRTGRLHLDRRQPVGQPLEVVEFRGRHPRQRRLVTQRRREFRVLGEPLEGRQLPVGKCAQQVHDGGPVLRLRGRGGPVLVGDSGGCGRFGSVVRRLHGAQNSPPAETRRGPAAD